MELFSSRRWRLYRPKQKAVVFMFNPQKLCNASMTNSIVVWLLGQTSCSSPSTKELHGYIDLIFSFALFLLFYELIRHSTEQAILTNGEIRTCDITKLVHDTTPHNSFVFKSVPAYFHPNTCLCSSLSLFLFYYIEDNPFSLWHKISLLCLCIRFVCVQSCTIHVCLCHL